MDSKIVIHCLGRFHVTIDGRPVERWRAGKARELLQFLLLRRGHIVPRNVLAETLWPEAPWSRNSSSLRVAVHMLRRIVADGQAPGPGSAGPGSAGPGSAGPGAAGGEAVADGDGSWMRLVTREPGYMLESRGVWIDFERFGELVDRGDRARAGGDGDRAGACFREAVELYEGDFLPDTTGEWAAPFRERLRGRVLYALDRLAMSDLLRDDQLAVMRWCRRMIEIEPLREESYRMLMFVHARLGQSSQVNRWYELCVTRLRELQLSPDDATQELYSHAMKGGLAFSGDRAAASDFVLSKLLSPESSGAAVFVGGPMDRSR